MNTAGRTPYLITGEKTKKLINDAVARHESGYPAFKEFAESHGMNAFQTHCGRVYGFTPKYGTKPDRKNWKLSESKKFYVPRTEELRKHMESLFVLDYAYLTRMLAGDEMAFIGDRAIHSIALTRFEHADKLAITVPSLKKSWWKPDSSEAQELQWSEYFELIETEQKYKAAMEANQKEGV